MLASCRYRVGIPKGLSYLLHEQYIDITGLVDASAVVSFYAGHSQWPVPKPEPVPGRRTGRDHDTTQKGQPTLVPSRHFVSVTPFGYSSSTPTLRHLALGRVSLGPLSSSHSRSAHGDAPHPLCPVTTQSAKAMKQPENRPQLPHLASGLMAAAAGSDKMQRACFGAACCRRLLARGDEDQFPLTSAHGLFLISLIPTTLNPNSRSPQGSCPPIPRETLPTKMDKPR